MRPASSGPGSGAPSVLRPRVLGWRNRSWGALAAPSKRDGAVSYADLDLRTRRGCEELNRRIDLVAERLRRAEDAFPSSHGGQ